MTPWILGQFESSETMLAAARELRTLGHADLDGYAPYPVHGLEEAFALPRSKVPLLVLCGALLGASAGYFMQWWCNAVDFPINVGGRPFHAPWANVPITFECGVLLGAFGAFFGLFTLLKLPRLHHPVFELEAFRSASQGHFWISIRSEDRARAQADLERLGANLVSVVEHVE